MLDQQLRHGNAELDRIALGQSGSLHGLSTSMPYQAPRKKIEMEPVIPDAVGGAVIHEQKPSKQQIAMPAPASTFQDSFNQFRDL